jgi:hypothetical protein
MPMLDHSRMVARPQRRDWLPNRLLTNASTGTRSFRSLIATVDDGVTYSDLTAVWN